MSQSALPPTTSPASAMTAPVSVSAPGLPSHEYTIDDLARVAGTTVRNVRAYQDRGILPPPERRGRVGIYDDNHLARLRVIAQLLSRGYTIGNIGELIQAWEKGHDLRQLLGLEAAITSPWSDESAQFYEAEDLVALLGDIDQSSLTKAIQLGIIEYAGDGARFRVPYPRLLNAGIELVSLGLPLGALLDIVGGMRANVEHVADALVKIVVQLVFDASYGKDSLPPPGEAEKLANLIWRLRPLADMAVGSEVARAMEQAIARHLGDRLETVMLHLRDQNPSGPSVASASSTGSSSTGSFPPSSSKGTS